VIGLQSRQRLIDLFGRRLLVVSIELGHEEHALSVPVAQRLAHAHFALAAVVVPAVVQKIDPVVHRRADNLDAVPLVLLHPDVISAQAYHRNFFAGFPQRPVGNPRLALCSPRKIVRSAYTRRSGHAGHHRHPQKVPSCYSAVLAIPGVLVRHAAPPSGSRSPPAYTSHTDSVYLATFDFAIIPAVHALVRQIEPARGPSCTFAVSRNPFPRSPSSACWGSHS